MTREQVIKALECCLEHEDCNPWTYCANPCPYGVINNGNGKCFAGLMEDALALLKEQEANTLLKEQEANTYCGFVAWGMEIAPQQVAYAAVTERLIKCGVLKVQIEDRPTGTVCTYAIRAVKWND